MQTFYRRLELPTIPHAALVGLHSLQFIDELEKHGFRTIVKDCSLGGLYPVVATLIYQPATNRYTIKFGSDPVFDVALQRCLCEVFQGFTVEDFIKERMLPFRWTSGGSSDKGQFRVQDQPAYALSRFRVDCNAQFVSSVMVSKGASSHREAFLDHSVDNRGHLEMLRQRLESTGHDIFVRDGGYLGFPSYLVYVPGMSERATRLDLSETDPGWVPEVVRKLLSIPSLSIDEKRTLARALESIPPDDTGDLNVADWLRIITDEECGLSHLLHEHILLAGLHCHLGDYAAAFEHLNAHVQRVTHDNTLSFENYEYIWCALAALRLPSTNLGSENTQQTLSHIFGEELAGEVMQDIGTPQKGFNNYILPRCGDCGACDLEGHCFYKEWRTLVGRLNEKMAANPIDQLALSKVFQTASSTLSR
ncbi:MAG: YcaO-like family protein [Myxococcota bacterium]|nr:YcaO-like family protein [Myxococcota bacterium]